MRLEWTKNSKTDKEKQEIEESVRRATIPFRRLREIIIEHLNSLSQGEETLSDFTDTSWAHKQAFRNGVRATHKYYLNLITLDQKDKQV